MYIKQKIIIKNKLASGEVGMAEKKLSKLINIVKWQPHLERGEDLRSY